MTESKEIERLGHEGTDIREPSTYKVIHAHLADMFPINNNTLVHVASNISTAVRAHQQERSRRADPLNDR